MFLTLGTYLSNSAQKNIFTDIRDGKQYKMIKIGNQIWMAENISYESENSWLYDDKKRFGKKHGRLYTWNEAVNACPDGWHLPNDNEWTKLIKFYGGEKFAGKKLSITGTSGFDLRLSGFRDSTGLYYDMGHVSVIWSSTSIDKYSAWRCYFDRGYEDVIQDYFSKEGALSVRCVKD